MAGRGVAQVIESDCSDLLVGAVVQARLGWQEYALIDMSINLHPFSAQGSPVVLRHRRRLALWHHSASGIRILAK